MFELIYVEWATYCEFVTFNTRLGRLQDRTKLHEDCDPEVTPIKQRDLMARLDIWWIRNLAASTDPDIYKVDR